MQCNEHIMGHLTLAKEKKSAIQWITNRSHPEHYHIKNVNAETYRAIVWGVADSLNTLRMIKG